VGVAAHPGGPLWCALTAEDVPVHALPVRHGFDVAAARVLRGLVATTDVVHFHTARAHALSLWLGTSGARRVVTRRMDYPPRPRPYARLLYNRCVDWVVAISRRIRDVLIAAGVDGERISVIPSGVDVARFRGTEDVRARVRHDECGVASGEPVVLVVGALVPRKGHAVLLRAARSLAARGLRPAYVFCGEGSGRSELEGLAADLGIAGRVRFTGWRSDVAPLLAAADLVVVPSLHEGLGVAALEAGAAARPVIASRTGGLAEVVVDGETGWLVPPEDPEALAAALEAALRDAEEARRRGAAARARIAQEFPMERMGAATAALYRRLVHHVA
jgi:glycosyltransferase involved in cell wall biosynthesis